LRGLPWSNPPSLWLTVAYLEPAQAGFVVMAAPGFQPEGTAGCAGYTDVPLLLMATPGVPLPTRAVSNARALRAAEEETEAAVLLVAFRAEGAAPASHPARGPCIFPPFPSP
jgi:hypothetical protein